MEIDQDNLRTGTAKAVARLMSFAQITFISTSYMPSYAWAFMNCGVCGALTVTGVEWYVLPSISRLLSTKYISHL